MMTKGECRVGDAGVVVGIAGLVVAVVAVGVSVWQGRMSKQQLDLAEKSEGRTERALEEIRTLSRENRDLASTMKSDIDDRINKFLDHQLTTLREEAEGKRRDADLERAIKERDDEMSSQMAADAMRGLGGWLGGMLGEAAEAAKQKGGPETIESSRGENDDGDPSA